MTSDKKDNSNGASSAPGSPKRPPRTIELEAEEVETASDQDQKEGGDDDSPDRTGEESPVPPPQRTSPFEIKSFATHLTAGLAGGLIGVIGAGFVLNTTPPSDPVGKSEALNEITQIEQRLSVLDRNLTTQSKALEGVARPERLDALEARLKAVENKQEVAPAAPRDLTSRIAKLEDTLKTLISAAGREGASGLEQSAALTARIEEVSSSLDKRAAALQDEIAQVSKTIEERAARQQDNGAPAATEISARGPDFGGAGLALAFESLWRAVGRGDAYAPQLEALASLAPEGLDFSVLKSRAGSGVESTRTLLSALPPLLSDVRAASGKAGDGTFLGRIVSNAQSVVRVRRIGPAEGDNAGAVLARMEARMKAGDLSGVVLEAKALTGPALRSLQPWLGRARASLTVRAGLDELEKSLLASLRPGAGR